MTTLATLALCTVVAYLVYRALDTGAPAGWYLTLPTTTPRPATVQSGNPCWATSGTIESDNASVDLRGAWATPSVCATVPVAAGEQAPARADAAAWTLALPRVQAVVGALCFQLDGQAVKVSESDAAGAWQVTDRFTDKVLARVSAKIACGRDGRTTKLTAEVL
jgi:hypothetical protein